MSNLNPFDRKEPAYLIGEKIGFGTGLFVFFTILFFINSRISLFPQFRYIQYISTILLIYLIALVVEKMVR